jgi:hypothetical protein
MGGFIGFETQGSPRGLGQPWAECCNTVGVVVGALREPWKNGGSIYEYNFPDITLESGFISPLAIVAALYERRFPKNAMRSAVTDRRYRTYETAPAPEVRAIFDLIQRKGFN